MKETAMSEKPKEENEQAASSGLDDPPCYAVRALKWTHCGKEGWMSEYSTTIEIEDEGAGEFVMLTQPFASTKLSEGGIGITEEEWPTLRDAIEAAFEEISKHNAGGDA